MTNSPTNLRTLRAAAILLAAGMAASAAFGAAGGPPRGQGQDERRDQPASRPSTTRSPGQTVRPTPAPAPAPAPARPNVRSPGETVRPAPAPAPAPAPRVTVRSPGETVRPTPAPPPPAPRPAPVRTPAETVRPAPAPAPAPTPPSAGSPSPRQGAPAPRPSGDGRSPRSSDPAPAPRPTRDRPRTGEPVRLPSGVDTVGAKPSRPSFPRTVDGAPSTGHSAGIPLPSGVDTARRHQDRSGGSRPPAAPGPSMRLDAPGAPARDYGTPRQTPSPSPRPGRDHDNNDRGDHRRDDHNDRHDRDWRHNDWRGHRSWNSWSEWNSPCITRPTNYAYSFGLGFGYTDLYPAGTFGYQNSWTYPSLYAWQYDTTPIYTWDTPQTYTTSYCPDVWAWQGCLTSPQTFVTGGTWSVEQPTFIVDPGVTVVQDSVAAPTVVAQPSLEQLRAESRMLSRINRTYDVSPDFASALDGAIAGDYSAAIYAMRRAAGVNPAAMVGADSRIARALRDDRELAQRAAFARQVFQSPPQRVVSEVDAQFMVGALSAAMGETESAEQYLAAAQASGDGAISTELLRRAVRGENLDPSGPWVPGRPLTR